MEKYNRDLLVLLNEEVASDSLDKEVESLHALLHIVEKIENISISHEVINVNKYRIFSDKRTVMKVLTSKRIKPFIFLNNLN